jgi:hypothetical protein
VLGLADRVTITADAGAAAAIAGHIGSASRHNVLIRGSRRTGIQLS